MRTFHLANGAGFVQRTFVTTQRLKKSAVQFSHGEGAEFVIMKIKMSSGGRKFLRVKCCKNGKIVVQKEMGKKERKR